MINATAKNGFSMIEVLVSIVVLSIGLLGVAGMQVIGLRGLNISYERSQAIILMQEFSDILRSNPVMLDADKFGTAAAGADEIDTSSIVYAKTSTCETITGCTPTQMADTALSYWADRVQNTLPSGQATSNREGDVYTVTIAWLGDKENNVTKSFQTSFIP